LGISLSYFPDVLAVWRVMKSVKSERKPMIIYFLLGTIVGGSLVIISVWDKLVLYRKEVTNSRESINRLEKLNHRLRFEEFLKADRAKSDPDEQYLGELDETAA
jgi:hypothetical protein